MDRPSSLSCSAIEVLVRRVGFCFRSVDRPIKMFRRAVDRVQAQNVVTGIEDIVSGPGRNDHAVAAFDGVCRAVDLDLSCPIFEAEELVSILVDFFTNVIARLNGHENQLNVLASIKDLSKEIVFFGHFLDIACKSVHLA